MKNDQCACKPSPRSKLPKIRKARALRLIALAIAFVVPVGYGWSLCLWSNSCFSGTGACTDDPCHLCYVVGYGADQTACYTSGSGECCLCHWRVDRCDCIFYPATRRVTQRILVSWTACNSGPCGTTCPGHTPPPLPL